MWVRLTDDIERSIYLLGAYDYAALRTFGLLIQPGDVVVDVGAHVGQFSLRGALAAGETGRVLAFEPQGKISHRLQRNVLENDLHSVEVFRVALGNEERTGRLHPTEDDSNSGLASLCVELEDCPRPHEEIQLRRLDDLVREAGLSSFDVLKIDVEGFEAEVLLGAAEAIAKSWPAIVMEANEINATDMPPSSTALDHLVQQGYELFAIGSPSGDAPYLHRLETGGQADTLRQRGRPIKVVALHRDWRGYSRAMRWVVTPRPVELPG
jgi:FkbM family methyltransferase